MLLAARTVLCALPLLALALYGVIGLPPTAPGAVVVPPAGIDGPMQPRRQGGPLLILLVGTSLTSRGIWPDRLAEGLAACAPVGVAVERLARSGESIRWGLPALIARLADLTLQPPDIVIAEFGGNDASPHRGLPLPLSRRRTLRLVAAIRAAGAVPLLATMSPEWGREGAKRPGQARYHSMYRDVAAETGAGLIDTVPLWLALPAAERRMLVPDDAHPTDIGSEFITLPAFRAALKPLVCGWLGTGRTENDDFRHRRHHPYYDVARLARCPAEP